MVADSPALPGDFNSRSSRFRDSTRHPRRLPVGDELRGIILTQRGKGWHHPPGRPRVRVCTGLFTFRTRHCLSPGKMALTRARAPAGPFPHTPGPPHRYGGEKISAFRRNPGLDAATTPDRVISGPPVFLRGIRRTCRPARRPPRPRPAAPPPGQAGPVPRYSRPESPGCPASAGWIRAPRGPSPGRRARPARHFQGGETRTIRPRPSHAHRKPGNRSPRKPEEEKNFPGSESSRHSRGKRVPLPGFRKNSFPTRRGTPSPPRPRRPEGSIPADGFGKRRPHRHPPGEIECSERREQRSRMRVFPRYPRDSTTDPAGSPRRQIPHAVPPPPERSCSR